MDGEFSFTEDDEEDLEVRSNSLSRLFEFRDYLATHDPAYKTELAKVLGMNRRTVYRYIEKLETMGIRVITNEDGKVYIPRETYLANVNFTLNEAMALYLAARLLATRTDRRNKHAARAVGKLGVACKKAAPEISRQMLRTGQYVDSDEQMQDQTFLAVLERLTQAMAEGKRVSFWYRKDQMGEDNPYDDFAPYFIEPYAVGRTTYVGGCYADSPKIYTYKVERITRVNLTDRGYQIPNSFNPAVYLEDAWGIWTANKEQKPEMVVLRFSKEKTIRRVKETRWHHTQQVSDRPDGSMIWSAEVAAPKEMLSWILGWGAEVEVIAPEWLRGLVADEAQKMVEKYR